MKRKSFAGIAGIIALLFCTAPLPAAITLSQLFSDNMVLQQQTEAPIWGKAKPNKTVKLTTSWDNQSYTTKADEQGKWKISVKTPGAGGPYNITISDGKALRLDNILIGEVWICSGQSNMEMPLAGWGKVLNYQEEINSADYPQIRLLHIEHATSVQPIEEIQQTRGSWQICSPSNIPEFSSTAYFFGRDLHQHLNVPVGLISTSWGGTIAEAWTSGEALEHMPDFREEVQQMKNKSNEELLVQYEKDIVEWDRTIDTSDKGFEGIDIHYNDSQWQTMKLPDLWDNHGMKHYNGIVWFRKTVEIPENWAGKDVQLNLAMVDDHDITYFNGTEIGSNFNPNQYRVYTIPGKLVKKGNNILYVRVTDTGGAGGIHGETNRFTLSLGEEKISLAGEWKYKPTVDFSDFRPRPVSPANNPNKASVLYNAMIHPLIPYAIQGAIWYQGESNDSRPYQYRELFPLLIRDWRNRWNRNFPFYFVQLANFREPQAEPSEAGWPYLREAQLMTLDVENTGMAVTIDIGDASDIHPKNKQEVGRRLSLNARAKTYGQNISYSGPVYESYRIEGDKIRIRFTHAEQGLKTRNNEKVKGFAIAGPDHKFYWGEAVIEGNEIVVSSPAVKFPTAVRYAWADNPDCNLYNRDELPASPFRTDDWK